LLCESWRPLRLCGEIGVLSRTQSLSNGFCKLISFMRPDQYMPAILVVNPDTAIPGHIVRSTFPRPPDTPPAILPDRSVRSRLASYHIL
jgi:hypothetical protein